MSMSSTTSPILNPSNHNDGSRIEVISSSPTQFPINIGIEQSILEEALIDIYDSIITDEDDPMENEEIHWLRHDRLEHKSMHWLKRPSLFMIVGIIFCFAFSVGFSILPRLELMLRLLCRSQLSLSDADDQDQQHMISSCDKLLSQIKLSEVQKITSVIGALLSMALSSKLGVMSDIYGRKPILILNMIIYLLSTVIHWILLRNSVVKFHRNWFILASSIEIMGGLPMVINSYVIDVADEDKRIVSLGMLSLAMGIGLSTGPICSSQLMKYFFTDSSSSHTTLTISCWLAICLLLFTIFVLPESRSERSRKKSRDDSMSQSELRDIILQQLIQQQNRSYIWSHHALESLKSFITPLKLLWLPPNINIISNRKNFERRITLLLLISCDLLWAFATNLVMAAMVLYGTFYFEWGSIQLGYFISISSGSSLLVLIFLSPIILNFIKSHSYTNPDKVDGVDKITLQILLLFELLTVALMISATTSNQFMFAGAVEGFRSLFTPAIKSSVVKYAPLHATGAMMGALNTLENFAQLIGPYMFLSVYQHTVKTQPKMFLYVLAGIVALCGIFIFAISAKSHIELSDDEEEEEEVVLVLE